MEIIYKLQHDSKNSQAENLSLKSQHESLQKRYLQETNYLKSILQESESMNSEINNNYSKLMHEILMLEKRSAEMEHKYLDITSRHSQRDAYYVPSSFQVDRSLQDRSIKSENKKNKSNYQLDSAEGNEESSDFSINTSTQEETMLTLLSKIDFIIQTNLSQEDGRQIDRVLAQNPVFNTIQMLMSLIMDKNKKIQNEKTQLESVILKNGILEKELMELRSELKVRSSVVTSPRNCLTESTSINIGQDSISKLLELQKGVKDEDRKSSG